MPANSMFNGDFFRKNHLGFTRGGFVWSFDDPKIPQKCVDIIHQNWGYLQRDNLLLRRNNSSISWLTCVVGKLCYCLGAKKSTKYNLSKIVKSRVNQSQNVYEWQSISLYNYNFVNSCAIYCIQWQLKRSFNIYFWALNWNKRWLNKVEVHGIKFYALLCTISPQIMYKTKGKCICKFLPVLMGVPTPVSLHARNLITHWLEYFYICSVTISCCNYSLRVNSWRDNHHIIQIQISGNHPVRKSWNKVFNIYINILFLNFTYEKWY